MKAVVWHGRDDVRIDEIPDAAPPRPGEIRVAVEWCGICGTDIEEWRYGPLFIPVEEPHPLTGRQAPLVLGHEVTGRVADVGNGVTGLSEGELVSLDALIQCGQCWWCRRHRVTLCEKLAAVGLQADGGLAEFVTVPAQMCVPVPAGVDEATAALAEPLAVAVRGIRRGRLRIGESVVVLGAGMIGLATLAAARSSGASVVLVGDPVEERRNLATALGADATFDPSTEGWLEVVRAQTDGRGADLAIDAAGTESSGPQAVEAVRAGGRAVIVGLFPGASTFRFFDLATGEKEVIGSLSHVWDEDFAIAVQLLSDDVLSAELVRAVKVPLEAAVTDGFEALEKPNAPVKILIGPRRRHDERVTH